jgi:predicted NAD/FAD-dependent oxidoreductase
MRSTRSLTEVAVLGAGIAGLTAACELARAGVRVVVFDKGRGVGGRTSTRRDEAGGTFDHGAQYFTTRDERFAEQVGAWLAEGVVAEWSARLASLTIDSAGQVLRGPAPEGTRRYVGVGAMNAVARRLAAEVTAIAGDGAVRTGVRVAPPKGIGSGGQPRLRLSSDTGESLGDFDRVLVTAPPPQAAELLSSSPALSNAAQSVGVGACWATMLTFDQPTGIDFDGAFVRADEGAPACVLSWVARDSSKPGRDPSAERWVLHASPAWSDAHVESSADWVGPQLLEALGWIAGGVRLDGAAIASHLWRFALPVNALANRSLADPERGLYAGGDWCGGPRVEGAYLSGLAAAEAILAHA